MHKTLINGRFFKKNYIGMNVFSKKKIITLTSSSSTFLKNPHNYNFINKNIRYFSSSEGQLDPKEVTERVLKAIQTLPKFQESPKEIKPDSHFANDLGLDSLDTVEVIMALEDEFSIEIPDQDSEKIHTCTEAIKYILSNPHAK